MGIANVELTRPDDPEVAELARVTAKPRARSTVAWTAALLLTLAAYALLLSAYWAPATVHPDANGYWAQASLLMTTGRTWSRPESGAQYIGMHWLVTPTGQYISRYPPGLAVLVGLVWKQWGWAASTLVNPILATLTLLGTFAIVKRLAGPGWGIVAAVALALNVPFTVHALTNISHMPVAFCFVWGVYALLRWSQSGRIAWAFVAGAILGCIPTVRYADAVLGLGAAAFLLMHAGTFPKVRRHWLAAAVGAAIPIVPLLIRNQLLLGRFWRTGYALTNEQTGFGWVYFRNNAVGYLQSLQNGGLGLLFALGLAGLVAMICLRRWRATGVMLLLSSTALLLVYMAYYWAAGVGGGPPGGGRGGGGPGGAIGGSLRFLVPLTPVYVIAGTWLLDQATRNLNRAARIAVPLAILAMQATLYAAPLDQELRREHDQKVPLAIATRGLEQVAARGDVVLAGGNVLQDLDFVRQWKLADPSIVSGVGPMGGRRFGGPDGGGPGGDHDPDAPSPMQMEKNELRAKLYTGTTEQRQRQFMTDVRHWAGPDHAVWVIGNEDDFPRLAPGVPKDQLTIVKRLPTPKPPPEPDGPQRRGGFGDGGRPGGFAGPRRFGGPGFPGAIGMRDGGGGGPFGRGLAPGEDIVIARVAASPLTSGVP